MSSEPGDTRPAPAAEPLHCCQQLKQAVEFRCAEHPEVGACPDYVLSFEGKFDEYGIWIHDGERGAGQSVLSIAYCPFCGVRLPESRRDEWFRRRDSGGLDPDETLEMMHVYGWWLRNP